MQLLGRCLSRAVDSGTRKIRWNCRNLSCGRFAPVGDRNGGIYPVACVAPWVAAPIFGARGRGRTVRGYFAPSTIITTMVSPISRAIFVSKIHKSSCWRRDQIGVACLGPGRCSARRDFADKGLMCIRNVIVSYLIYLAIVLVLCDRQTNCQSL